MNRFYKLFQFVFNSYGKRNGNDPVFLSLANSIFRKLFLYPNLSISKEYTLGVFSDLIISQLKKGNMSILLESNRYKDAAINKIISMNAKENSIMQKRKEQNVLEYEGGCLCNETTYIAKGKPSEPHLCSCTMCQKSSGSPTVAWVRFPLESFQWNKNQPGRYRSSEKTDRCFCHQCGGLLGTLNDGYPYVFITIATLNNPNLIVPGKQHSYEESAPSWWRPHVLNNQEEETQQLPPASTINLQELSIFSLSENTGAKIESPIAIGKQSSVQEDEDILKNV